MNKMLKKSNYIYIMALMYLLLPLIIFLLGNIKIVYSVPLLLLIIVAFYKVVNDLPMMEQSLFRDRRIFFVIVLIIVWVLFSGIGGFIWQNPWDHKFRNAIFMDMVKYKWPIINNNRLLCYYLGFWLPSALVGKLFGLNIGYLFQVLWAIIGVFITYGLLCQYFKKVRISIMLFFIFYSGLDIILFILFSRLSLMGAINAAFSGTHIELVLKYFNSSSNTTLLFWLYNQIIPFWVGMLLILLQKNSKSLFFIYSLMMLYSPFALVSLFPIIVYKILSDGGNKMLSFLNIKAFFSYRNVVAFIVVFILALYYKTNIAVGKLEFVNFNFEILVLFICYLFFEYIVYLIFVYKKNYKDYMLNILLFMTMIESFITLGISYDFAWRTNIPLSFYIMLLLMKEIYDKDVFLKRKLIILVVFSLGAITPISEIIRTFKNENDVLRGKLEARSDSLPSVFQKDGNECYENFIGDTDSFFNVFLK